MEQRHDAQNTYLLRLASVILLLVGCVAVLLPFVGTLLLAIVVCVTSWPLYELIQKRLGNRPTLAALIMALLLILILLLPMIVLSGSLASGVELIIQQVKPWVENGFPAEPPAWLAGIPLIGVEIVDYWHKLAENRAELNKVLQQLLDPTRQVLLSTVKVFGQGLLQVGLVIFFVFFIFKDVDGYASGARSLAKKLGDELGERMLTMAQGTVTGVMVGIVGTAAAQALVGMIGYLIAGLPAVLLLTFATFIFSMVPVVGATVIWGGATVWLYQDGQTGMAIFMAIWGMLAISGVDNFVKPILISRTAALPLLLIIIGVFGGVLVFGFIGLFLGPTLLALGSTLIREWISRGAQLNQPSEIEG